MNTYTVEIRYTDILGNNVEKEITLQGKDVMDIVNQVYESYNLADYNNFSVGDISVLCVS